MPTIGGIDLTAGTIAAFGALLVYDVFFVTYHQEITLVWPSRWNYGKVLFFLNRYLPFFDTFLSLHLLIGKSTDRGCLLGFRAVTWLIVVGIIIAEIILMIRTYAIWGQNRFILIILILIGAGAFIPGIAVTQIEVNSLAYRASPEGGCVKTRSSSPIIFVAFLLLIICETTIVILTLIRAWQHHKSRELRSPLVKTLYKDGLFYYIYILAFSLVNLLTAVAAPPQFTNWLTTPQRVLHSLFCTRVLLHIRAHGSNADSEVMSTQVAMSFAEREYGREEQQGLSVLTSDSATTGKTSSASGSVSASGSGSGAGTRLHLTFTSSGMSMSEAGSPSGVESPASGYDAKYDDLYQHTRVDPPEEIELQTLDHRVPVIKLEDSEKEDGGFTAQVETCRRDKGKQRV